MEPGLNAYSCFVWIVTAANREKPRHVVRDKFSKRRFLAGSDSVMDPWRLSMCICYSILFLAGLANLFILCFIPAKRNLRTVRNVSLFNICLSGLIFNCTLPFVVSVNLRRLWDFGTIGCKLVMGLEVVAKQASVLFSMSASIERYLLVCKSHIWRQVATAQNAMLLCLVIWTLSFLVMSPVWIHASVVIGNYSVPSLAPMNGDHSVNTTTSITERPHCMFNFAHRQAFNVCSSFVSFLIPTSVIIVCYSLIMSTMLASRRQVRRHQELRAENSVARSDRAMGVHERASALLSVSFRNRQGGLRSTLGSEVGSSSIASSPSPRRKREPKFAQKSTRNVQILVTFYLLCWFPYCLVNFIVAWGLIQAPYSPACQLTLNIIHMLPYVNSAVNPFLYGFMTDNFRRAFGRSRHAMGTNQSNRFTVELQSRREAEPATPTVNRNSRINRNRFSQSLEEMLPAAAEQACSSEERGKKPLGSVRFRSYQTCDKRLIAESSMAPSSGTDSIFHQPISILITEY